MTGEQMLISALGAVTGALCYCVRILFREADECKKGRADLQTKIEALLLDAGVKERKYGEVRGALAAVEECPMQGCPWRNSSRKPDSEMKSTPLIPQFRLTQKKQPKP